MIYDTIWPVIIAAIVGFVALPPPQFIIYCCRSSLKVPGTGEPVIVDSCVLAKYLFVSMTFGLYLIAIFVTGLFMMGVVRDNVWLREDDE